MVQGAFHVLRPKFVGVLKIFVSWHVKHEAMYIVDDVK